jgi:hypothetical protein
VCWRIIPTLTYTESTHKMLHTSVNIKKKSNGMLLGHYATGHKVAGLRPDEVNESFRSH